MFDAERRKAAQELGLPVDEDGPVLYLDAQLEYTDANRRTGRVNIEIALSHYRDRAILAKSNAGFALYATGAAKTRVLRALAGAGARAMTLPEVLPRGTWPPSSCREETMQPWKVSARLSTAIAGLAALLVGTRLEYLSPLRNRSCPTTA